MPLKRRAPIKDEQWTTLEGRTMWVEEMSEAHAKNTLRMLLRQRRESLMARLYLGEEMDDPDLLCGPNRDRYGSLE